MFPLHTKTFPTNADELEHLLNESLRQVLRTNVQPVRVVDREFPALQEIAIDMDGAVVAVEPPPPRTIVGAKSPAFQIERLNLRANDLSLGPATADIALEANNVRLHQGRDARDEIVLGLHGAADGKLEVSTSAADLERGIEEMAKREAAKHGVTVENVRLNLRQVGPGAIEGEAILRARKLFFPANVRLTGKLAIDDELNAVVSDLRCAGDGAIGALASSFLGPQLEKLEGRSFPLMAFALGEIRLRDVQLTVGERLLVRAEFGAAT